MRLILVLAMFLSAGAATAREPEIVQVSPDTYLIVHDNHAGIFANMAKTKRQVIKRANDFAQSQGKIVVPISIEEKRAGPGQWPRVEYQFRIVSADDHEAQRTTLESPADVHIRVDHGTVRPTQVPAKPPNAASDSDVYQRLLRLDDLRSRGIITQEEFEAEKRKVLGN